MPTSKPSFLNHSFRYALDIAINDVAQIIGMVNTELTANGWTSPGSTGPWTSPIYETYKYIVLTLTRVSASVLEMTVVDRRGITIFGSRRAYIESSGNTAVRVFSGPEYFFIEITRSTSESLSCFIMDAYPEDPFKTKNCYVAMHGYRNNFGTADSYTWDQWYRARDIGGDYNGGYASFRLKPLGFMIDSLSNFIFFPIMVGCLSDGINNKFMGMIPNALIGPKRTAYLTQIVPLGDGTTGTFMPISSRGTGNQIMYLRSA